MQKLSVPAMKCLKPLPTYALSFFLLLIPLSVFSFEITKKELEKIACSQLRNLYSNVTCKGIIFYGNRLKLEGEGYLFMVKKSGNSFLLEVVDPKTLKPVRVIPIKTDSTTGENRTKGIPYGKKVKVVFINGNIRIETDGVVVGKGYSNHTVKVKVGKKYFVGVLQNEDTVVIKLY